MPLVWPDVGKIIALNDLIPPLTVLSIRLYKNDETPDHDSVDSDFEEADYGGYVEQDAEDWTDAELDAERRAFVTANTLTWTHDTGTGNDIYGYTLWDGDDNFVAAERFSIAPINMNIDGATFDMIPQITLKSEFNN